MRNGPVHEETMLLFPVERDGATEARCPVCREGLEGVKCRLCPKCDTPHHAACWDYVGVCAVFACGGKTPPGRAAPPVTPVTSRPARTTRPGPAMMPDPTPAAVPVFLLVFFCGLGMLIFQKTRVPTWPPEAPRQEQVVAPYERPAVHAPARADSADCRSFWIGDT